MVNFIDVDTTLADFKFLCPKESDVLEAFGKRWCEVNEEQVQYGVNYMPNRFLSTQTSSCSHVCGYAYAK